VLTTPYVIDGSMVQVRQTASGGDGFAVSLGATYQLRPSLHVGLALEDVFSGIWWNHWPGERTVGLRLDSMSVYRYYQQPVLDSFMVSTDEFVPGGTQWMPFPATLAAGVAFAPSRLFRAGLLVNLPFGWSPFIAERPIAGLNVDFQPFRFLGLTAFAGWHRQEGLVGRAAIATQVRGFGFGLGAEVQGRSLTGLRNGKLQVRFGYVLQRRAR
jgi:hypothetical protein